MKIVLRNFLSTLRRYKASSALNIVGLTIAFTAFYVLLVQAWWELGYNRSLPDAERIYLIETEDWHTPGRWSSWLNRPVPERVIASTADVETGGCMWGGFGESTVWRQNATRTGYDKVAASSGQISLPFVDVFAFRSVAGDVHDIRKPGSAIVSRRTAERLGVGIGDPVWVDVETPTAENAREVVALFEDFPDNSLLAECQIAVDLGDTYLDNGSEWSFNYFVKLRPGADAHTFEQRWIEVIREMIREQQGPAADEEETYVPGIRLSPVEALYFESDSQVPCRQGSKATTYSLLGIAALVIVLAFVNFVNFFFALVPVRIRSVNTYKVFGAPTAALRFGFIFEAVGLVVLSLAAAWYAVFLLRGSVLASYIACTLRVGDNLPVAAAVVATALTMALAASLYPAWYITSFAPAMVVKGSFGGTRSGRRLRTALIGFQFFIATALIVGTGFIRLQHSYMMRYDMGFDRKNLMAVYLPGSAANRYTALRQTLVGDPRVEEVTGAASRMVSVGRMGWGRQFKGERVSFQTYVVQWNFLRTLGIDIVDGRDFSEEDARKELGTLIVNRTAAQKYGIAVGDRINGFVSPDEPFVGICADFNFQPLQYDVQPFAFYVLPASMSQNYDRAGQVAYIRYRPGTDLESLAEYVRGCVAALDGRIEPGELVVRTFDEELGREYETERRLSVIVGLFTLLAVAIALMGVFGIVLFETQHRRREIAVRKVMGATTGEILRMFNRRYLAMAVVCFAVSVLVSVWAVGRWLSQFAYRTPLVWWVFAAALAAVAGITTLTVTLRSWHAANENPADCVKSE